jgi:hypothetical protein
VAYPHIKYQKRKSHFFHKSIFIIKIRKPRRSGTYIANKSKHEREKKMRKAFTGKNHLAEFVAKRDAEAD